MLLSFTQTTSLPPKLPFLNPIPIRHVPSSLPFSRSAPHFPKATSIAGSSAEFPEQVAGDPPRQQIRRRRSVAGVDQDELVDPTELADPDSAFFELNGVQIHHKITHHEEEEEKEERESQSTQTAGIGVPMILLHGFGASVFSWDRVMKPLARFARSKVLAFDRPAFGLTSRAVEGSTAMALNPYSMAFSVLATVSFIDLLGAGKAILMGHSAGCLVAVNTYFEAPEKVAALILVAPAIVAPLFLKKGKDNQMEDGGSPNLGSESNFLIRIWSWVCRWFKIVAGMAFQVLRAMGDMVSSAYKRAVAAVLRSGTAVMLVRMIMDKFGILAVRNAWYDASQVTDYVLQGYTKPLRAKGWERALLEYTIAVITDSTSKSVPPLTKRLSEITCPVLIVTGDTDRLVPSWNAERLSRAIPGSTFEVIRNCGHLPHEEKVEEVLQVIEKFLQRVFGGQDVPSSQAALQH